MQAQIAHKPVRTYTNLQVHKIWSKLSKLGFYKGLNRGLPHGIVREILGTRRLGYSSHVSGLVSKINLLLLLFLLAFFRFITMLPNRNSVLAKIKQNSTGPSGHTTKQSLPGICVHKRYLLRALKSMNSTLFGLFRSLGVLLASRINPLSSGSCLVYALLALHK